MITPTAAATDQSAPDTIVNTRHFATTREGLFRACQEPARLAQWWGPRGFTNTFEEFDFRPEGAWRYVMRAPDGTEFPNESRFVTITPPERIVLVHERPMHRFELTMTFVPEGNGTQLTWRMRFDDATEVTKLGTFIRDANEQNFDRLQTHLAAHP